jgi:hypothetical protein
VQWSILRHVDGQREATGWPASRDIVLVAGTEAEEAHAAEVITHLDGVLAAMGRPGARVVDLRMR